MDLIRLQITDGAYIDMGVPKWTPEFVNPQRSTTHLTIKFPIRTETYYEEIGKIIENVDADIKLFIYKNIDWYDLDFNIALAMRSVYHKSNPDLIMSGGKIITVTQESNCSIISVSYRNDVIHDTTTNIAKSIEDEIISELIKKL